MSIIFILIYKDTNNQCKIQIFQTILFIAKRDTYVYHPITNTLSEQSLLQNNLIERMNPIGTLTTK